MGGAGLSLLREDLKGKISWFITLRWLAVVGLVLAISAGRFFFGIALPLVYLYPGAGALMIYNGIFYAVNRRLRVRIEEPDWLGRAYRLASLQVFLDLSLLTYLLFFSGGLENPFVFYYIFHMILSGILLTRRSAYLQGTFAVAMFALLLTAHRLRWIPQLAVSAAGPAGITDFGSATVVGWAIAFSSTVYIAVYLTTTIMGKLRQREQELEEQDRLKSRYVMTVSHDIQASLSAVQSLLMTVLGGFTGRVASQSRTLLERASLRTRNLLRFVRDLLDISRMRTEIEVEKQQVALLELVRSQAELFAKPLQDKRLDLQIDVPSEKLYLWANRGALEQLLNNLLSNAIRYTPCEGRISVSIRRRPHENLVDILVADTGIGIPAESLPNIFDDFFRAQNARGFTDSGTGLGLSIVKKIVESHRGEIRVESEVGSGTSFYFSLPLQIAQYAEQQ